MKVQYCSDLHLEFSSNTSFIRNNPLPVTGDCLVLAGDISYLGRTRRQDKWFFDWCGDNFSQTFYVPGNHEFYDYSDISSVELPFREALCSNVFLLSNTSVEAGGCNLLFTPLFSHIPESESMIIKLCMNDFRRILYHGKTLSVEDYNKINDVCLSFLESELEHSLTPALIFTHHVPLSTCSSDEHKRSLLKNAFSNDLDDMVARYSSKIRYWIFGHSHHSICLDLGQTSFRSNQLGYVGENEHSGFCGDSIIEI